MTELLSFFPPGTRSLSGEVNKKRPLSDIMTDPRLPKQRRKLGHRVRNTARINNASTHARDQAIDLEDYFIALDLDECSLLGSDTNDLLRIATHAYDHVGSSGATIANTDRLNLDDRLRASAKSIVNPALVDAIERIRDNIGYTPYIVAYTNKGVIQRLAAEYLQHIHFCYNELNKSENITPADKMGLEDWYKTVDFKQIIISKPQGGTIFFEGSDKSDDFMYHMNVLDTIMKPLTDMATKYSVHTLRGVYVQGKRRQLEEHMRRATLGTWAISHLLGLDYNIPMFVSAVRYKNLNDILPTLGLTSIHNIYLYDDKANEHFDTMVKEIFNDSKARATQKGLTSALDFHMIQIQPFTATNMDVFRRYNVALATMPLLKRDQDGFWQSHQTLKREASMPTPDWSSSQTMVSPMTGDIQVGGGTLGRHTGLDGRLHWSIVPFKRRRLFSMHHGRTSTLSCFFNPYMLNNLNLGY